MSSIGQESSTIYFNEELLRLSRPEELNEMVNNKFGFDLQRIIPNQRHGLSISGLPNNCLGYTEPLHYFGYLG